MVSLLPPHVLFDGVTAIVHYETAHHVRTGTFEDRAEEVTRALGDANYSAWCDAVGTVGGLPELWIWHSDPFLRVVPFYPAAARRMHTALNRVLLNCRPAYDWDSLPVHKPAEAALSWLERYCY